MRRVAVPYAIGCVSALIVRHSPSLLGSATRTFYQGPSRILLQQQQQEQQQGTEQSAKESTTTNSTTNADADTAASSLWAEQTLGVPRTATPDEIKLAFRRRALKTHPAFCADGAIRSEARAKAAEDFRRVCDAYRVMSAAYAPGTSPEVMFRDAFDGRSVEEVREALASYRHAEDVKARATSLFEGFDRSEINEFAELNEKTRTAGAPPSFYSRLRTFAQCVEKSAEGLEKERLGGTKYDWSIWKQTYGETSESKENNTNTNVARGHRGATSSSSSSFQPFRSGCGSAIWDHIQQHIQQDAQRHHHHHGSSCDRRRNYWDSSCSYYRNGGKSTKYTNNNNAEGSSTQEGSTFRRYGDDSARHVRRFPSSGHGGRVVAVVLSVIVVSMAVPVLAKLVLMAGLVWIIVSLW